MPGSLTDVGTSAFASCDNITKVTVPQAVVDRDKNTETGDQIKSVFTTAYKNITEINFSGEVTTIGYYAFDQCESIESINLPSTLNSISSWSFNKCTGLTTITFPDSLETLGRDVFSGCINLTSVTFNEGLKTITNCTFRDCTGLTSISLPSTLETMTSTPFYGCTNITSIYIDKYSTDASYANNAPWGATNSTVTWKQPAESGT